MYSILMVVAKHRRDISMECTPRLHLYPVGESDPMIARSGYTAERCAAVERISVEVERADMPGGF